MDYNSIWRFQKSGEYHQSFSVNLFAGCSYYCSVFFKSKPYWNKISVIRLNRVWNRKIIFSPQFMISRYFFPILALFPNQLHDINERSGIQFPLDNNSAISFILLFRMNPQRSKITDWSKGAAEYKANRIFLFNRN